MDVLSRRIGWNKNTTYTTLFQPLEPGTFGSASSDLNFGEEDSKGVENIGQIVEEGAHGFSEQDIPYGVMDSEAFFERLDNGTLRYQGEQVRIYWDEMLGSYQSREHGFVDIVVERNRLGEITAVSAVRAGDAEYDRRTREYSEKRY